MEFRPLGSSDLNVSLVGLGCNNFKGRIDLDTSRAVVHKALDMGINFLDTADVYGGRGGSEEFLGEILGSNRKQIILATKFCMPMDDQGELSGASRQYIFSAVDSSLKRLKTDWIDLYQVHRPDESTPIEETMLALNDLVSSGKVRYIGCSNFSSNQVTDSFDAADRANTSKFVSCQDEYSLLVRASEKELFSTMKKYKINLLPYFPLASGLLTGKYKRNEDLPDNSRFAAWPKLSDRYMSDKNWDLLENLQDYCKKNQKSLLELAFSWLAANPLTASIIAGATSPEQVEQNVLSCSWTLSASSLDEINKILI